MLRPLPPRARPVGRRGRRRRRRPPPSSPPTSPRSTAAPPTSGPRTHAVVATRDLAVGTVLDAADLRTRAVHRSQLPTGALTDRRRARRPRRHRPGAARQLRRRAQPRAARPHRARRRAARRACGRSASTSPTWRVARVGRGGRRARELRPGRRRHATRRRSSWPPASLVLAHRPRRRRAAPGGRRAGVTLLVDPDEAYDLADAQANGVAHARARAARGGRRRTATSSAPGRRSIRRHATGLGTPCRSSTRSSSASCRAIRVPADLVERSPDPRPRAVRLDRAHRRTTRSTRPSTSRCTSAPSSRRSWYFRRDVGRYVVAALALDPHALDRLRSTRGSRGCCC